MYKKACLELAISLHSYTASLVQWVNPLLPVMRDPGSIPRRGICVELHGILRLAWSRYRLCNVSICMTRIAVVIFLFLVVEALLTRVSRASSSAVPCLSQQLGCYWLLQQSNQFLILYSILCGPRKNMFCNRISSLWRAGYIPTDCQTSWGVLHHPCKVPVYKLLCNCQ